MLILGQQAETIPAAVYVIIGIMIAIVAAFLIFWIWQLVDCIKNELPGSAQKWTWTIIILIFGGLGAFVYNIGRRKKRIQELGR